MTKPKLKLVASASAPHPRPFETMYYGDVRSRPAEWAARGRAASARGACRAAFLRVLERRAALAVVHGPDGVVIARVWREGRGGRSICATGSAIVAGVLE